MANLNKGDDLCWN